MQPSADAWLSRELLERNAMCHHVHMFSCIGTRPSLLYLITYKTGACQPRLSVTNECPQLAGT